MKILGIATMGSSAAAICIDGIVVAAIEEERLTRLKNDGGFPLEAIRLCLNSTGLNLAEIDLIAVYWQPWRIHTRTLGVLRSIITNPHNAAMIARRAYDAVFGNVSKDEYPEMRGSWIDLFKIRSILRSTFGEFKADVKFFDHHLCHAASIYHLSEFESALCLTYDGGGETASTVLFAIENGNFNRLKTINWPNSLGHFYSAFTGFLGFRMLEGEYKMMGLAPYGTPRFTEQILDRLLQKRPNGEYELNTNILNYHAALRGQFTDALKQMFGPPREPSEPFTDHHQDIAASVQAAYEEILLHLLSWAKTQMPEFRNLCIAGGCGLNVTANGKVIEHGLFDKILIPPAPHDAGCSIGAAWLGELDNGKDHDLRMPHPYLGKAYSDEDIEATIRTLGLTTPDKLEQSEQIERMSTALANGEVVAWYNGASEFGPRALGNRSFLADPRDDGIREVLNAKIKKRELFRPFAPSCKKEVAAEFFEIDQESPYMNIVATVRPEMRNKIPAVTHVDGTARVHTVDRETNPKYWALIDAFEGKTGVGVLLNTSLNIQEPIVENPEQAIQCFLRSSVDWLSIGSFVCGSEWRAQAKDKLVARHRA